MQKIRSCLTIFFEDPFWVGVYERISDGQLEVCKITFGAEPKDYEIADYLHHHWAMLKFSPPVAAEGNSPVRINPKRMQRMIQLNLQERGVGTKAQEALKLQRDENKLKRKTKSRQQLAAEKQYQYDLHQQKRREKHRGH